MKENLTFDYWWENFANTRKSAGEAERLYAKLGWEAGRSSAYREVELDELGHYDYETDGWEE